MMRSIVTGTIEPLVAVTEVDHYEEPEDGYNPLGDAPTDWARLCIDRSGEVFVEWRPPRFGSPAGVMGEALEALLHEVGHVMAERLPGKLLALEVPTASWQIAVVRQLEATNPVTIGLAEKTAKTALDLMDLPWEDRQWAFGVLGIEEREL